MCSSDLIGIFGFIALKAFGKIRPIFRERGKLNAEVTGRLTETLNGVRVIKGFNAEESENRTSLVGVLPAKHIRFLMGMITKPVDHKKRVIECSDKFCF